MYGPPDNQGKCCDAVLRVLEGQLGYPREYVRRDGPSRGDVEVVCRLGAARFAVEHTRIDPFPDRVPDDVRTLTFMKPIIEELEGDAALPADGSFMIVLDVGSLSKARRHEHERLRRAIVEWVRAIAPTLPVPPAGRVSSVRAQPAGLSFAITLQRMRRSNRRISYARFAPPELEARRLERIGEALDAKLPKLAAYRRTGASTVLVLEDDDIALSNHTLIGVAVHDLLRNVSLEPPDFIFLVETLLPSLWSICPLKAEGVTWPDDQDRIADSREFDSADLVDILAL